MANFFVYNYYLFYIIIIILLKLLLFIAKIYIFLSIRMAPFFCMVRVYAWQNWNKHQWDTPQVCHQKHSFDDLVVYFVFKRKLLFSVPTKASDLLPWLDTIEVTLDKTSFYRVRYTSIHIHSPLLAFFLFHYLTSILLFPCTRVRENSRAWVPHFI